MGDHLATVDMGRKLGGCCAPFRGELGPHLSQCGLGRGQHVCTTLGAFCTHNKTPAVVDLLLYLVA